MTDIIARSEEASVGEDFSLKTYYHYVEAWRIAYELKYKSDESFKDEVRRLASTSRRPIIPKSDFDKGAYFRGALTLKLMSDLPLEEYPELAFKANIWLPIHSYYAIQGVGLALLTLRKANLPERVNHKEFRSTFTDAVLRSLFPYPFNALCAGGPTMDSFSFRNIDTSVTQVRAQRNWTSPSLASNIDDYIGKSLFTTRHKTLDDKYAKRRVDKKRIKPGYTRHNIGKAEKETICRNLCDTSICDFLYRMRKRSNYDNPIMYLSGTNDVERACSHYKDLLRITEALIEGIDTLIEFYLGKKEFGKIKSELKPFEMPEKEDIPF
jgi:hypothetical protein